MPGEYIGEGVHVGTDPREEIPAVQPRGEPRRPVGEPAIQLTAGLSPRPQRGLVGHQPSDIAQDAPRVPNVRTATTATDRSRTGGICQAG